MGLLLPDGGRCGGNGAAPPLGGTAITNKIAVGLALLVLAFLAVDYHFTGWAMVLFLARKFILLIEYLAFWR